jgi:hypothetical protein
MQLDRNKNPDGRQKYALIKLRVDQPVPLKEYPDLVTVQAKAVDFGNTSDTEFFVIKLKDKYAFSALSAYAAAAAADDTEYADQVYELALKAAAHPNKKIPD